MSRIMEIVSFRTSGGREAFVDAYGEIDAWVVQQPGFVSRHLVRNEDESWTDLVLWNSLEEAKTAADRFGAELGTCAAVGMIEKDSISMSHAPVISSLPS